MNRRSFLSTVLALIVAPIAVLKAKRECARKEQIIDLIYEQNKELNRRFRNALNQEQLGRPITERWCGLCEEWHESKMDILGVPVIECPSLCGDQIQMLLLRS